MVWVGQALQLSCHTPPFSQNSVTRKALFACSKNLALFTEGTQPPCPAVNSTSSLVNGRQASLKHFAGICNCSRSKLPGMSRQQGGAHSEGCAEELNNIFTSTGLRTSDLLHASPGTASQCAA